MSCRQSPRSLPRKNDFVSMQLEKAAIEPCTVKPSTT